MSAGPTLRAAAVRVPCSTSNLGSGYDTIGLALDRYLEVTFEPDASGSELRLERTGTLTRLTRDGGSDLVADTFSRVVSERGQHAAGMLRLHSTIPVSRGLGSSAAAVLAGFDLARAALGLPRADAEALAAAYAHEHHADNAAPCLYGGLQAIAPTPLGPRVVALDLSPAVGFAYAAPPKGLSTEAARAVLPTTVAHRTAVAAIGHVTALVRGLALGDPELIRIGIEDELHVPHRLPMIAGALEVIGAGYEAGAWAVTISGAGSGLIALCDPQRASVVAAAMREVFASGEDDPECVGFAVRPDFQGLQRV